MTTAEKNLCTYCESVADPNGNVTEGLYEVTSEDLVRFSNTENKELIDKLQKRIIEIIKKP